MKKLLIALVLTATGLSGWAQGTVDFRNSANFVTVADRKVYDVGGTVPLVGTNFLAQLYYLAGADRGAEILQAGIAVTNNPVNFRVPPATGFEGTWTGGGSRTLMGVPQQTMATLQVRVWDRALGSSWEAALAALATGASGKTGLSVPFNYNVPAAGSPANQFYMENLRAFALVPEPSVILLGAIGAAAFLLRRRKN
jgi:hypothetical protein